MLRGVRRRISHLEESIPLAITAERFLARAHGYARRAGGSVESAIATIAQELSDSELHSLTDEFEQIAFGSDIAARDAAKREVYAEAGYPDWTSAAGEEQRNL
jgi:hypothetical protein